MSVIIRKFHSMKNAKKIAAENSTVVNYEPKVSAHKYNVNIQTTFSLPEVKVRRQTFLEFKTTVPKVNNDLFHLWLRDVKLEQYTGVK